MMYYSRKLFLTVLFLSGMFYTYAQNKFHIGIQGGISAGTTMQTKGNNQSYSETIAGILPSAGFRLSYSITEKLFLQSGLSFQQLKYSTYSYSEGMLSDTTAYIRQEWHNQSFSKLVIPLTLHYTSWNNSLFVSGGIRFNHFIYGKDYRKTIYQPGSITNISETQYNPLNQSSYFEQKNSLQYVFGLGYNISAQWQIQGNYCLGKNITYSKTPNANGELLGASALTNSEITFTITYFFSHKNTNNPK